MLVNQVLREKSGSNLKAEIFYEETSGYRIQYSINDIKSGEHFMGETSMDKVNETIEKWFNGVQYLNG